MGKCVYCEKDVVGDGPADNNTHEHRACVVEGHRRSSEGLCLVCGDRLENGNKVFGKTHAKCDNTPSKGYPVA